MAFDQIGRWDQERLQAPTEWRIIGGTTLHHMIDWETLRCFWNELVERRDRAATARNQPAIVQQLEAAIVRYLEIAGFVGAGVVANAQCVLPELRGRHMHDFRLRNLPAHDNLATALCWQRYNLFEGPPWQYRPNHSPDPRHPDILEHFADIGVAPTYFDFPIIVPPHGYRANTLLRAFQQMTAFNETGDFGALEACLSLLEHVRHLLVIPAYDINWYALLRADFLALTPTQRQRFFRACFQYGWNPPADRIQQAYAQATAA